VLATVVRFYRDPLSWLALGVTTVVMCYLGGAAMFWYHAILLGEAGPAIAWYEHWLLDSTVAFVALTPALAVILPLAAWGALTVARSRRWLPWLFAVAGGGAFALITTPGPIAHDLIVGRGTWLADRVTALVGDPAAPLAPAAHYPAGLDLLQQIGAGLPLYIILMRLTVMMMQALVGWVRGPAPAGAGSAT